MAAILANGLYNENNNPWLTNTFGPNQVVNRTEIIARPCPFVPPVLVSYMYGSPVGWNAVLVGLLSSVLALVFLLICLYYLAFRRRCFSDVSDRTSGIVIDKEAAAKIPVTCTSQTATTTFINEPGKETKISTYTEQSSGPVATGDFVVSMPSVGNGHTTPSPTNGLLVNGNTDPSELRLLQHEHH